MTPFFYSEERRAGLLAELERWRGTPFVAHTALCGIGVDCVRFAGTVLESVGAIRSVGWPEYAIRGVGPGWRDLIEAKLREAAWGLESVHRGEERAGDVMILGGSTGIVHAGLVGLDGRWWHAMPRYGVRESRLDDLNVMKHWIASWRIMEVAA